VNPEAKVFTTGSFSSPHEHADAPHALALQRACRERPCRRAAEERDEFAPSKSR
jgi:hypothetical protein